VSYPFGSASTNPSARAMRAAARMSSMDASGRPKAMLSRTLSENSKLSSMTSPTASRNDASLSRRTGTPPTVTVPPVTS
jgi:hypothetical protein